jgi:predicted RNA binding protein YcfA (HicA-like mRNA interferase family)
MSQRLRQLSGRAVAAVFVRFGFEVVATRGSHCKLRRTLTSGERQTLTIPLHTSLATGTLHALYRQGCRFVPDADLRRHFYSGEPSDTDPVERGGQESARRKKAHRRR